MTGTKAATATAARERRKDVIPPGTPAPDFTLRATPDQNLTLSDLVGQPVILAFYPADWSPVCGDELVLFNELLPEFELDHCETGDHAKDAQQKLPPPLTLVYEQTRQHDHAGHQPVDAEQLDQHE